MLEHFLCARWQCGGRWGVVVVVDRVIGLGGRSRHDRLNVAAHLAHGLVEIADDGRIVRVQGTLVYARCVASQEVQLIDNVLT